MNIQSLFNSLFGMLRPMIPFVGSGALSAAERAVTIPEHDIRHMCAGMPEAKVIKAVHLGRVMADSVSDFAVYVASRGEIEPD